MNDRLPSEPAQIGGAAMPPSEAMNWDYSGRLQKAQMDVAEIIPDLGYRLES